MEQKPMAKILILILTSSMLVGCIVVAQPRRHVVVYGPAPEVVYTDAAPAPPYEVVTEAPGPEFVWVAPVYVRVGDHWALRHGHWARR